MESYDDSFLFTLSDILFMFEVMNCSMLHNEDKVMLESVVVSDSRSDVVPLNAYVLWKLPLDLDLINGFDLVSKKRFLVSPQLKNQILLL